MGTPLIKSSQKDWLERALAQYSDRKAFSFEDDAEVGLTEADLLSAAALIKAANNKAGIPWKTIAGALSGIGLSAAGVWIVAAAIADPEPTSKLALLTVGGFVLALTGGLGTLAALGVKFTVKGRAGGQEFEIRPETD